MFIGYARVSTDDQNLDLQRDALTAAGCETVCGGLEARPGGLRRTAQGARRGGLKVLTGQGASIYTTKPDGRMMFGMRAC